MYIYGIKYMIYAFTFIINNKIYKNQILKSLKALKNCSGDPVWRLVRTSNPGGVKAPGVRFALRSDFF